MCFSYVRVSRHHGTWPIKVINISAYARTVWLFFIFFFFFYLFVCVCVYFYVLLLVAAGAHLHIKKTSSVEVFIRDVNFYDFLSFLFLVCCYITGAQNNDDVVAENGTTIQPEVTREKEHFLKISFRTIEFWMPLDFLFQIRANAPIPKFLPTLPVFFLFYYFLHQDAWR